MSKVHSVAAAPSHLEQLWLSEAIRLREAQGERLEDREANRQARAAGGDFSQRVKARAIWLAQRDGQLAALAHYQQGARLALAILLLLAVSTGAALALGVLGDAQRPVNLFWALASLLGVNLLMLSGWLLSGLMPSHAGGTLGRLWQWLSAKLARDAQVAQLLPALMLLLQRQRLNRWAFGLLSNGLWLLTLSSALGMLTLLLASRRYDFIWETTLLASDSFVSLTQALGALPALLGFSQPSELMIRASGTATLLDDSSRQAWASWLLGVLLMFGLLPRLLLTLLCLAGWRRGIGRLSLDLSLPDYQLLRAHLQPSSERLGISAAAPALPAISAASANQQASSGALLVAIELDPQRPWPPTLPNGVADAGVLDSREQRQHLLEQLSRFPPARLAIACDPRRSPDRGTLALLGELARSAAATRIWLLPPAPGETLDSQRLGDWHQALAQLQLPHADSAPFNWLESGHD